MINYKEVQERKIRMFKEFQKKLKQYENNKSK